MYRTMKEIPKEERPYEKCQKNGVHSLTDHELLSVILRTGTKNCTVMELAEKICSAHPVHHGILGLPYLSYEHLTKIKGVGPVKAVQVLCIAELAKRLSASKAKERLKLMTPSAIANYYMESTRYLTKEHLMILLLDSKNCLIKDSILSIGTINASLISPREIFLEALHYEAVNIILIHNHPSGDSTPSHQDIQVTKRIAQAGKLLGIQLVDHIILGEHQYTSLFEQGLLNSDC